MIVEVIHAELCIYTPFFKKLGQYTFAVDRMDTPGSIYSIK